MWVIATGNPIQAVASLIYIFMAAGTILFIFRVDIFGVLFVIIFVGAVAILFLFITMMLNIKNKTPKAPSYVCKDEDFTIKRHQIIPGVAFTVLLFIYLCKDNVAENSGHVTLYKSNLDNRFIERETNEIFFDYSENISTLGQSLFNYYSISFLLAGLVLLIALIGAVCLTLHFNTNKKSQITSKQLARSDSFLSYFRKKKDN